MDVGVTFNSEALSRLFQGHIGKSDVTVSIEGDLQGGGRFYAPLPLTIVSTRRNLAASIWPNPFAGTGTLSFRTESRGPVNVGLFDVRGRLVRRILETVDSPPQAFNLPLNAGFGLTSGVYFYRVWTPEATAHGRVTIIR